MHLEKLLLCLRNNDTQVGFHTGNGTTQEVIDLDKANKNNIVVNCNIRKVRNKDKNETYMRVNPNKNNNGYILTEYTAFKKVMQDVFDELGVKDFKWKRIDMSFNTMDNKYYANYTKLNRLLIACIANSTNDKNTYDTKNFWNGKTKSLATKNQLREVEFYDKADESNNRSPYYSRLELRSVRMNGDIEHEFLEVWFERLDKAIEEFEAVQDRFNQNMAEIYLDDLAKKKHDREFLSINSFLMTRRDYIFTSTQMKKLLMLLGLSKEEAKNKAYNFKKYHAIEYFKREDLEAIVADIKAKIQEAINTMQKDGRASSSMRDALGRVRDCLESAKHNRIISENPCFEISVPWENKQVLRRFLSVQEQNLFLQTVEHNWYKEMFYIMFLTGMRIGEVGGLKWCDVDFENECIHINQSLSCNYEKGVKKMCLTTPKTHNSYRKIPFMGEAKEMFLAQKKKQDKIKRELGKRYRCEGEFADLVFVTSMGSPVLRYHAEKECKKVVKAINEAEAFDSVREQRKPIIFEDVYPHALRHTFCSRCFEKGMNPKVVQALMGHQHYSTTIEIYTHVTEQKFDEEIAKFGSAMVDNTVPKVTEDVPKSEIA